MASDSSVAKLLESLAEVGPLAERLERIKRLQERYRTLAPAPLAEASRVCAIEGTTVVVVAKSGPVAAALRQIAPRLVLGLRETARNAPKSAEDQELTSMRVQVQVSDARPARAPRRREPLPRERLARMAEGLADSPLKDTLKRMARKPKT